MRRAELLMAIAMAIFSAYLMWMSAKLPIGWVPGRGPGGGSFPFWLSFAMLICTVWIIVRWFRRTTPQSRSSEPFFDSRSLTLVLLVIGALVTMVGSIYFIGVYGALPLFFVFYMRFLGRHSWAKTMTLALAAPVITFFFFEILLHITLPKGATETLFYPLYDIFM
ncbi:MAG: tripartite tricarboxylate transporter TctB family protein [Gammaproteobacteria bacterium]|nr:tripartite tricarboxylate transporter TctB family protein [Gammaproteobacteria bacterium]MDH3561138.1 tripartite tricarboxylate transporter TctB family protein [Gammaproteobacteria bacterium]